MGENNLNITPGITYIGPYCDPTQNHRNLLTQPSGMAKMEYIISALQRTGLRLTVYSPAPTKNNHFCHFPRHTTHLDPGSEIKYADTFGGPTIFFKAVSRLWSFIQLFFFLLGVKSGEPVLVYHVYQYRFVINTILFFRKIRLFFEVEEIYNVLWRASANQQASEIKYLDKADGYIFVNDVIASQCKLDQKPHAVCYGDYRMKPGMAKINDGLVHLVYSGMIGGNNSAVNVSLNAISLLPSNYQLHVTGYGEKKHTDQLTNDIGSINAALKREAVVYHGCLDNERYIRLISSFHIGLTTSELSSYESLFMFPSKLLVYLGVNLAAVASPLSCLEKSLLSSIITFSEDNTPRSMATAIQSIEISKINNAGLLNELDRQFTANLIKLFGKNES
jgi:hypothetical protein